MGLLKSIEMGWLVHNDKGTNKPRNGIKFRLTHTALTNNHCLVHTDSNLLQQHTVWRKQCQKYHYHMSGCHTFDRQQISLHCTNAESMATHELPFGRCEIPCRSCEHNVLRNTVALCICEAMVHIYIFTAMYVVLDFTSLVLFIYSSNLLIRPLSTKGILLLLLINPNIS